MINLARLILVFLLAWVSPSFAGLSLSSGTGAHTHADANTGGASLSPASVAATGAVTAGSVAATGAVTAGSVAATGAVTAGSVAATGGVTAGSVSATSTASINMLVLTNTSTFGACVRFLGNGGTTPGKSLCAFNGNLDFWNSAETSAIFRLRDDGSLVGLKACAAGYVRIGPNYCGKQTTLSTTTLVAGVCSAITNPGGAFGFDLHVRSVALSANAVGDRFTTVAIFTEATCAGTGITQQQAVGYEFSAVVGIAVGRAAGNLLAPTATPYILMTRDAGAGGSGFYEVRGYFD